MRFRRPARDAPRIIQLGFRASLDPEWLALGHTFFCVRILAQVRLPSRFGGAVTYEAILDTGSTVSVIPRFIWEQVRAVSTGRHSTMGGGLTGREAAGELGFVSVRITDSVAVSPPLTLRALLLQDDSVPLVLGFGDLLTQARLHCDFPGSSAYLEFLPQTP